MPLESRRILVLVLSVLDADIVLFMWMRMLCFSIFHLKMRVGRRSEYQVSVKSCAEGALRQLNSSHIRS